MRPNEIEVGKTYHNGKTGNSYSARLALEFKTHWNGVRYIEYKQIAGRLRGQIDRITAQSFGRWAKGEVEDTNA